MGVVWGGGEGDVAYYGHALRAATEDGTEMHDNRGACDKGFDL